MVPKSGSIPSSSWRSRFISEGIRPVYFFFQLKYVAWLIPALRPTPAGHPSLMLAHRHCRICPIRSLKILHG